MPPKRKKQGKVQNRRKKRARLNGEKSPAKMVKKEVDEIELEETEVDEDPDKDVEPDIEAGPVEKAGSIDKQDLPSKIWKITAKKPTISCKECSKKFRFEASFKRHLELEHSKLPGSVQCDQCPVRCPDAKCLKEHIAKFHEREIFECPECKKTFVRHAHVLRHMVQKGCDGNNTYLFPCEICGAQFSRKDNLMVHLRMQHILRKKYACKQCQYSTSSFSKLCLHRNKFHLAEKKFECDHCGKVVTSRPAMCKHLEIHGEKKYSCDVCGYMTFTVEVMRRHVLTHVEDKPYKCDECKQSFIQRAQLERHTVAKHGGGHFICPICKITAWTKNKIFAHMKKHKGADEMVCPYEGCEIYNKPFETRKALENHLATHFSSRPYSCEICNKSYRHINDMRRHVASHTLERPRRCMYCVTARAYVRGIQLVRHVRKAHPQVFREHLTHVRQVLGTQQTLARVKQSELESILNVLDAEADRILEGYGEGVLYGGMQETAPDTVEVELQPPCKVDHPEILPPPSTKKESNPLLSEEELAENLSKLLVQLIDKELLQCCGWPTDTVDAVLEKVIEQCGAKPADREKWTRVQCLRENAKHLFLHVIEDKNITRMLDSHTIDQIVKHILAQVTKEPDDAPEEVID